jgi:hypothetical protein
VAERYGDGFFRNLARRLLDIVADFEVGDSVRVQASQRHDETQVGSTLQLENQL